MKDSKSKTPITIGIIVIKKQPTKYYTIACIQTTAIASTTAQHTIIVIVIIIGSMACMGNMGSKGNKGRRAVTAVTFSIQHYYSLKQCVDALLMIILINLSSVEFDMLSEQNTGWLPHSLSISRCLSFGWLNGWLDMWLWIFKWMTRYCHCCVVDASLQTWVFCIYQVQLIVCLSVLYFFFFFFSCMPHFLLMLNLCI